MSRLTPEEQLRRSIPEEQVQRTVLDALRSLGYTWHHNADSRRSTAGLPDIVAVRNGTIVMLEIKKEQGRLRPEQIEWFSTLLDNDRIGPYWAGLVRDVTDARPVLFVNWIAGVVRPSNLDDCIRWLTEAAT